MLAVAALAGCQSGYGWSKEGAASGETELARRDCASESQGYDFLDGPNRSQRIMTSRGERYSRINANGAVRQADIYSECMRAKGFSLGPDDEN